MKRGEGNFLTMTSPMKPLIFPLGILSVLLGNVVDVEKLKKSDGRVFEKSRFVVAKFFVLIVLSIGTFVFFGSICAMENIR